MRTSEIPPYVSGTIESVITLVEVTPDFFRLRLTPTQNFQGPPGTPGNPGNNGLPGADGTNGAPGTPGTNGTNGTPGMNGSNGSNGSNGTDAEASFQLSLSDLTTALTTGTSKAYFRAPFALTITGLRASLLTASSAGVVTIGINEGGTTILSTDLTIDANETTSVTAATQPVISDPNIADDAILTFDIDTAGTGAAGLIVTIYWTAV